jgi:hypothetical protein
MDVNGARHDDAASSVDGPVGSATRRRRNDLVVPDPEVALAETAVDGIDDVAAGNFRQHGNAASAET